MSNAVPAEISVQLSLALNAIERHLESTLLAVHLYGSALDGGLKPYSDIDLLVTVAAQLDETVRQALVVDLLEISASPGQSEALRALEVTIVVHGDVVPWRYPARRELQFGEWQRKDILAGIFEPATTDVDLAILLTKVRQHSLALAGSAAEDFFNPVPEGDLFKALSDTLKLWNSQPDWEGDERNVVLTLSRIWYSAATGKIAPKDIVANWAIERLPDQHKPVLLEARQAYLGQGEDCLASRADQLAAFVHFVKHEATKLLGAMPVMSKTKLGITKYSIVTNSNDSVTLRLMTEHDLAMLYEWLNRSHIVEWWGGEEARPTLADVQEQYLPSVLAQESVTPYIAMLNGEPIGYAQSYVALGSGDGWWEEETDPGVRGIDQSLANASQLGKGLGTKLVRALVELLFNDPEVTKIQTDPSPSNLRAIRCYEKAGFERQGTVTTPDGPAVYMVQTRQAFERTRSDA
ncbi:fused aminoglycoside (3'') adenylyltransferase-aminoglycoside (6') acetyltransferase ANT(3'')-Ih-AAC(6')-IId (plasmid) [Serratia marcescens]|nr:fused aminoglycoside (3'') adenylyltransferase-aminoglycoside (6') acetyltransferase ANT(3'')-Ih-AAC(6')-IId [Serratia marcescens]QWP89943.1 bifunctional aminoglycoside nucleotidyltransferase ANT(3'')-Ih/aminoglycoside N-acetyltransferase AAC(6')-Iid [Pseudomonas aeruginosa]